MPVLQAVLPKTLPSFAKKLNLNEAYRGKHFVPACPSAAPALRRVVYRGKHWTPNVACVGSQSVPASVGFAAFSAPTPGPCAELGLTAFSLHSRHDSVAPNGCLDGSVSVAYRRSGKATRGEQETFGGSVEAWDRYIEDIFRISCI